MAKDIYDHEPTIYEVINEVSELKDKKLMHVLQKRFIERISLERFLETEDYTAEELKKYSQTIVELFKKHYKGV